MKRPMAQRRDVRGAAEASRGEDRAGYQALFDPRRQKGAKRLEGAGRGLPRSAGA